MVARLPTGVLSFEASQVVDAGMSPSHTGDGKVVGGAIEPPPAIGPQRANIWRVAWNATGTVIATSSDDGTLSLWRKNFAGIWINVQNLPSAFDTKMKHFYRQNV